MTDTPSTANCNGTCSIKGDSDLSCNDASSRPSRNAKIAMYGAGVISLCAICCAVPPALIALGFVGITGGAYLSAGSKVAMVVLAVLVLGYLLRQHLKKNR